MIPIEPLPIALIALLFLGAGVIEGSTGFAFPVITTMSLAAFIEPRLAVLLVIPGIIASNIKLTANLSRSQFEDCTARFWPLIVTILAFSLLGLFVVDGVPVALMEILLGGLTLSFVLFRESLIPLPFRERLEAICFGRDRRYMVALGSVFGLIFGMSNVGVQIVAYLKSLSLSHQVFVGVVGIVFIGVNVLRFTGGVATGLYPTTEFLLLSLGLTPAAYLGASLGIRYQERLPDRTISTLVSVVLTFISLRLILLPLL